MKILFLNVSGLKFTVQTPEDEPLGGSESALCYLARQLARNGHDVALMARLPDGAPDRNMGVRHFPVTTANDRSFFEAEQFDAIIVANAPVAVPVMREFSPRSFTLLWNHVTPDHHTMAELGNFLVQESLDGIVYVSDWQKAETEKHFGIAKASCVIGNGLTPSFENMFASAADVLRAKENCAAYTTTPFRGLSVLLRAMERLGTDTQLDIYSSMCIYQVQAGGDKYAVLYREAERNPFIRYHPPVSQTELPQRLRPVAFFTYPCTYAETFCNVALEAMAAGLKVIAPRLGALESTTMGFADLMPAGDANDAAFAADFRQLIINNVRAFQAQPEEWAERMFEQVQAVNRSCTWPLRAAAWEKMLALRTVI